MRLCRTIAMAMLVTIGLTGQSVLADDERGNPFTGLWEGIDPQDGGNQLRSIIRNEDGTFSLIGRDTYLSTCEGSELGVITGTGAIEDGVLKAKETVTCFNNGRSVTLEASYVLDRKDGTLINLTSLGIPPIILHQTSTQPEY
jgi:hypothetical protein